MPIYEYKCPSCGVVEAIQKFSDDALTQCPECNKENVEKMVSASAFHLKGQGWYKTDYTSSGKAGTERSSTDAKTTEPSKDSKKTDIKDTPKPSGGCGSSGCGC